MLAIDSGCEMDVERGPDCLLVRLRNLDASDPGSTQLAERLWTLMRQHFARRLVLELDDVGLLNSPLIGQFLLLYKRIEAHDGVMRLCGLSPYNRQVLRRCRLDDRLLPYADRREAVMAGSGPGLPR